ncbi:MAG: hypothetical protein AAFR61_14040 [Bacteroidota bacterium]
MAPTILLKLLLLLSFFLPLNLSAQKLEEVGWVLEKSLEEGIQQNIWERDADGQPCIHALSTNNQISSHFTLMFKGEEIPIVNQPMEAAEACVIYIKKLRVRAQKARVTFFYGDQVKGKFWLVYQDTGWAIRRGWFERRGDLPEGALRRKFFANF